MRKENGALMAPHPYDPWFEICEDCLNVFHVDRKALNEDGLCVTCSAKDHNERMKWVLKWTVLIGGILLLLSLFPLTCHAQALRVVSDGLIVTDCTTTVVALKQPSMVETNPFLGVHPTPMRVASMCGVALLLNDVGVRWLVGKRNGNWIWALVTVAEAYAVIHNGAQLGWRVRL